MRVRQVFKCLFENAERQELVYAWHEDLDGFIVYEDCMDPTQQKHKLTKMRFYEVYRRI